ncbi:MAG: AI-2E family transporter [Candidatus Aminicenantes bacterium]|nr:AI-2E family transporter [Candidatus Aminicenantes bacterium]
MTPTRNPPAPGAKEYDLVDRDRFLGAAVAALVLFAAAAFLKVAKPFLFPILLAVFFSYILDPALGFLEKRRFPRPAAAAVVLLLAFVLLYLLGTLVYSSGKTLATELPKYQQRLTELSLLLDKGVGPFHLDVSSVLEKIDFDRAAALILSGLGPFLAFVLKLFLVFLFLGVIVAGRGKGLARVRKIFSPDQAGRITAVLAATNSQVRKYLVIKTAISLGTGFQVWVVLVIFGVDFALLFGFLAFILNFIPYIGSIVAAVLRVSFAFFQLGTPWAPFWILVITVGLDSFLASFVEPRAMGQGLDLSPLLVLFSFLFWGWLWGLPGMVLAVPFTAAVKIFCQNVPGLRPIAVLMST